MPQSNLEVPLRILLLEDNASDAELISLILKKEGISIDMLRVETREGFLSALERQGFDIVLADCALPCFDGISAMQIARVRLPDVPFIFVSGTIGEELAIEMLKSGATDYVLKQRISRLGPAVRRAIAESREKTARKGAEKSRAEAESLFRALFDQVAVGVAVTDLSEHVLMANPALESMLGYNVGEIARLRLSELTYPEDQFAGAAEFGDLSAGLRSSCEVDKRFVRHDGTICWTHVVVSVIRDEAGAPRFFVNMVEDITDRKRMEQRFVHAQKMEVVGRMAAGFAHDFNNLLTVINGYSQLLLERLPQQDPVRRELQEIRGAGERATTLTQRMLTFSRQEVHRLNILDLNSIISGLEHMLRRLSGDQVRVSTHLRPNVGLVEADQTQIEQIIINLAINARDAMPEGGELIVETEQVYLDSIAGRRLGVLPGQYVALIVSDTGHGMDDATKALIFEPFFTTKEVGKGTGLGLWMAHGIVQKSGGTIAVDSQPGQGTRFRICLPSIAKEPGSALTSLARSINGAAYGGTETILIVSADESGRQIEEILMPAGYQVLRASEGTGALAIAKEHEGYIDLLIIDSSLLLEEADAPIKVLTELRPEMRFLILSAYREQILDRETRQRNIAFVEEPFSSETILRRVREALDAPLEANIVVADEDHAIRRFLRHILQPSGYAVVEASSSRQTIGLLREQKVDLLLIDLDMADQEHAGPLREALEGQSRTQVVGMSRTLAIPRADNLDAVEVLQKPFGAEAVQDLVHQLLAKTGRREPVD